MNFTRGIDKFGEQFIATRQALQKISKGLLHTNEQQR
jgi:hypothetical protein